MILFLIAFSGWLSYGQRLPMENSMPMDYEWRIGAEKSDLFVEWLGARENGKEVYGRELKYIKSIVKIKEGEFKGKDYNFGEIRFGGHDFARSVRDVDYQEINTVFSSGIGTLRAEAGIAYLWEKFGNPSPCIKVGLCYDKFMKVEFTQVSNFDDKCFMDLYIGKKVIFPINIPGLYFSWENFVKYLWAHEAIKYYQLKTELKVEFDFGKMFGIK